MFCIETYQILYNSVSISQTSPEKFSSLTRDVFSITNDFLIDDIFVLNDLYNSPLKLLSGWATMLPFSTGFITELMGRMIIEKKAYHGVAFITDLKSM